MMVIFEIPTIKLILNSIQTFAAGADECQVFFHKTVQYKNGLGSF